MKTLFSRILHEDAELVGGDHCGIRAFIEGGECKDTFVEWQECIKSTKEEKEVGEKCGCVTTLLIKCMHIIHIGHIVLRHYNTYEHILSDEGQ